ncbi:MAG: hypothetical protein JNM17_06095 [Archangium sp.]|nr:hypothetical protein [Archangium sp.]
MPERRQRNRRTNNAVPEPIERKRERRGGDRRESLRKKTRFVIIDGKTSREVAGEVGLGGASFTFAKAALSSELVVQLEIGDAVLRLPGKVTKGASGRAVHVAFSELDTKTELQLAKWLDGIES